MTLIDKLTEMFALIPPPQGVTETLMAGYLKHLADLPENQVCAAIDSLIEQSTFTPKIGEIRRAVIINNAGDFPLQDEAWQMALSEVSRVGSTLYRPEYRNKNITLDLPPIVQQAALTVGWRQLCETDERFRRPLEESFKRVYADLIDKELRGQQTGDIPLRSLVPPEDLAITGGENEQLS